MKTYFRYVRDEFGNGLGGIYIVEDNGNFGIGLSVRNSKDKFDKKVARELAEARCYDCFKDSPYSYYDMLDDAWEGELEAYLPQHQEDKFLAFYNTVCYIVNDITMDYARNWNRHILWNELM